MKIYLDYSATTPTRKEVIVQVQNILKQEWGNPNSIHSWGERAATIIEIARIQVASLIRANCESIIFTSGGTEADNLAVMGIARQYKTPQHIIISSVEHSAVTAPAKLLEEWGWQVTMLPVNAQGRINQVDLLSAIQANTVLISIIYGQSEVGTLQPIQELAHIARSHNIIFHTDAVQVAGKLPIDVQNLGVDLLSISSHKMYGIQGAGALYVRQGVHIEPLLLGGGQESGLRSGTQSVPAIAAFGLAAELAAQEMSEETPRLILLRDRLYDLLADCPYLLPTGDRLVRLPHHLSFIIKAKIQGREIVRQLNKAGIAISSGSACHSGKLSPSAVLLAMGYSESEAQTGIRLSLGKDTTQADVDSTAMILKQVLEQLISQSISYSSLR